jgi:hypothetical protein
MKLKAIALGAALAVLGPTVAQASSHREAPLLLMLFHFFKRPKEQPRDQPREQPKDQAPRTSRERLSVLRVGTAIPDFHRTELALR